jgi:hypothetical protein
MIGSWRWLIFRYVWSAVSSARICSLRRERVNSAYGIFDLLRMGALVARGLSLVTNARHNGACN